MLQEPFLFRGTIWHNLVYGLPTSTPEQAIAAAKAAQAHDFILNSPLGYDTWLGERGAGLSGGERQRLSIARAILYDPPILVLDEATSNVDAESEQAIQQALKALTRGRTTIAIAHRLSTLRDADRILVFDRGRLIEQGSHDELLANRTASTPSWCGCNRRSRPDSVDRQDHRAGSNAATRRRQLERTRQAP